MKQYTKPMLDVVELSVKENIAALPTAVAGNATQGTYTMGDTRVNMNVYNLATLSTSSIQ